MGNNSANRILNLASFAKLERFLTARRDSSSEESKLNFEEFEVSLCKLARKIENEIKADELARYDVKVPMITVGGKVYRKCLDDEAKRYMSTSGWISVSRNLYRPQGGGKSICPLELRAGIVGGVYTPVMARQITYMMGSMTARAGLLKNPVL